MRPDADCYRLNCSQCDWAARCREEQAVDWLRSIGKVRFGREPEWEILRELLLVSLDRLTCPECGAVGLSSEPWPNDVEDDWETGGEQCEGCRTPISPARLAALPSTRYCTKCQEAAERGESFDQVEYCPRCGAAMDLRQTRGRGITRYEMVCSAGSACRG